ncbi:GNAT family N-acetyltransferase [Metapseudomonas resinovorans]|uniref:N-acetyltransferase domain-containing protein n=1 Tax=Metapseudomonas resinovorans NBRC 106553 TaxID=1245471 RepID=S6AP50_METRE|nr:GNAT family N-acetyltransferase [Pseudomonas resinovorans]BAN47408.1 hypothetical protein PCA10_16760 [Pseudomonas resinovorans NBRC 106553]
MPSTELNLRPIEGADQAFLRELYASSRADEMAAVPWDDATKTAFLTQQFNAQHSYYQTHYHDADFSVVCHRNEPIGRLYVFRGPSVLNLIDVSLLPEWRGQGIGTGFLRALVDEADAAAKSIRLFVEPGNPAKRLYERFGFTVTGSNHVYLQMQRAATPALAVPA